MDEDELTDYWNRYKEKEIKESEWLYKKMNFTNSCARIILANTEIKFFENIAPYVLDSHTVENRKVNVKDIVGFDVMYKDYITWYDYFENENRFAPSDLDKVMNIPFDETVFSYNGQYYIKDGMHRISFLKFYSSFFNIEIHIKIPIIYFYVDKPKIKKVWFNFNSWFRG
jgi:hypothetical protein